MLKYEGSEARISINNTIELNTFEIDKNILKETFEIKHKETYGFLVEKKSVLLENVFVDT